MKNQRALAKAALFLLLALGVLCFHPGMGLAAGGAEAGASGAAVVAQWTGEEWANPDEAPAAGADEEDYGEADEFDDEFDEEFDEVGAIADPLEPLNRAIFVFNDKLYFWLLKPVARGYGFVVPEPGRVAINRFFTNLYTPIRLINSLLQFKFKYAGTELARFGINSTIGLLGFMDPARDRYGIYLHREDFGQTLGRYGAGPGFFLNLPLFGPSSVRDGIGLAGDFFMNPLTYIFYNEATAGLAVSVSDRVNNTSINIGVYEDLKKDALDPYTFIRDAYHQHREDLVKE